MLNDNNPFHKRGIGYLVFGLLVFFSYSEAQNYKEAICYIVCGFLMVMLFLIMNKYKLYRNGFYAIGVIFLTYSIQEQSVIECWLSMIIGVLFLILYYRINIEQFSGKIPADIIDKEQRLNRR